MKQFWQIVPTGDGYTYMGQEEDKIVPRLKISDDVDVSLIWENRSDCEAYLRKHLDPTKYNAEEVWLDEKYYEIKCDEQESTN